jgi:hypothetical protein
VFGFEQNAALLLGKTVYQFSQFLGERFHDACHTNSSVFGDTGSNVWYGELAKYTF